MSLYFLELFTAEVSAEENCNAKANELQGGRGASRNLQHRISENLLEKESHRKRRCSIGGYPNGL